MVTAAPNQVVSGAEPAWAVRSLRAPPLAARWPLGRYYRVAGGVLHSSIICRCINIHTVVELMPNLSGMPPGVVGRTHKLCRHCGYKAHTDWEQDTMIANAIRTPLITD